MKFKDYLKNKIETDSEFKELHSKYDLRFEVGELITEARIHKNLTQSELAELVGTKQSSISRIESGAVLPNLSFLEKVADAIGTYLVAPQFGFMLERKNSEVTQVNTEIPRTEKAIPQTIPYFLSGQVPINAVCSTRAVNTSSNPLGVHTLVPSN